MKSIERDDSLPHQIKLMYDKNNQNAVRVSCNCLAIMHPNRSLTYEFMPGFPSSVQESLAIYRDPANHRRAFPEVETSERVPDSETSAG